ncbi:UPF0147 family protein [Candidatus Woesearchaeota archaeon]|nr:UPF0147 family protein [Candidatus Woesearchaeota archaeon]
MDSIALILSYIDDLNEEMEVPKNINNKLQNIKNILKSDVDVSIKKSKCLNELDDLHENHNIDPNLRCQLWDIVSSLEQL